MYTFTSEQLQELKRIAKAEFHLDFSDEEILQMATNLVRAFVVLRAKRVQSEMSKESLDPAF